MSILCFGSYSTLMKESMPLNKGDVFDLLIYALLPRPRRDSDQTIDQSDKYKMMNSKLEVHQYIKDRVSIPEVTNVIEQYFTNNVVTQIQAPKRNELISRLIGVITGDDTITITDKQFLLANANVENMSSFLSRTFLFAVGRSNKHKTSPLPHSISDESVITVSTDGRLFLNGKEIPLPENLSPPDDIESSEEIYITELLRAYAERDGVASISIGTIPQRYQRNFIEQRQNYFNAEAVRRRVREVSDNAVNEFETFKQDTYNGIIDVHDQTHANGYERLLRVLQQASSLPQGRSLLERLPKWIGASEKKGACHILVNDKKIAWVVENE